MTEKKKSTTALIGGGMVIIILLLVVVIVAMFRRPVAADNEANNTPSPLGYATGVTVVDDPDALQAAVDAMMEQAEENMVVSYQNEAFSEDGETFSCFISNHEANPYDMYIGLYGDENFQDQLFLSGLMRPGEAFEEITLDHSLESGTHTCYLVQTQVEDDHETIHGQVVLTLEMTVA